MYCLPSYFPLYPKPKTTEKPFPKTPLSERLMTVEKVDEITRYSWVTTRLQMEIALEHECACLVTPINDDIYKLEIFTCNVA